jgi:hypothetical protein
MQMAKTQSTPAKNTAENKMTVEAVENKPEKTAAAEVMYSAADLSNAARSRFGVQPEVVQAALKAAGKTKASASEAEDIIKKFMERKVQ